MKSKIAKILGVVLTAVMLVGVIPFASITAGTQEWTESSDWEKMSLPSIENLVLAPTLLKAGPMAQAKDGKIYAYAEFGIPPVGEEDKYPPVGPSIIMSDDRGATWKVLDGLLPGYDTSVNPPVRNTLNKALTATPAIPPSTPAVCIPVVEIVCSTKDAGTIFITTGVTTYWSVNGGVNWTPIASVPAGAEILSMDVGVFDGKHYVMVGVNSATAGSTLDGGVYYWKEGENQTFVAYGSDTTSTGSFGKYNVYAVKVAPTFGTDRAVFAIGVNPTAVAPVPVALLRASVDGSPWGGNSLEVWFHDVNLAESTPTNAPVAWKIDAANINDADIAFPSDFDVTALSKANLLFCVATKDSSPYDATTNNTGVFRVIGAGSYVERFTAGSGNSQNGVPNSNKWCNISMSGSWTGTNRSVMVGGRDGRVIKCDNMNSLSLTVSGRPTFSTMNVPNVVNTEIAWVLLDINYGTPDVSGSLTSYVLNAGVNSGRWGGFSVATNTTTYLQRSLIDDELNWVIDFVIAANGDVFMITSDWDPINSVIQTHNSLWRFVGGAWERLNVYMASGPGASLYLYDRLALSPDYVSDKTIFMWYKGTALTSGTDPVGSDGNAILSRSVNNGFTFSNFGTVATGIQPSGYLAGVTGVGALSAVLPLDGNNVLIGGGATTGRSVVLWSNSGNSYTQTLTTLGTGTFVMDIKAASNGDLFAAGYEGSKVVVYKSTNGGKAWKILSDTITVTTLDNVVVAPADDYKTSGNIFVGVIATVSGSSTSRIWRYTDVKAKDVSDGKFIGLNSNGWVRDMIATPGVGSDYEGNGMIYAFGQYTYRIKGAWSYSEAIDPDNSQFDLLSQVNSKYGRILALPNVAGDVVLYVTNGGEIWSYTDTLNRAGTGLKFDGSIYNKTSKKSTASFSWNAMKNADSYTIVIADSDLGPYVKKSDWSTANAQAFSKMIDWGTGITGTSYTFTGLDFDTKYYVYVYVDEPVTSFAFAGVRSLTTAPANVIGNTYLQGSTTPDFQSVPVNGGFALGWDFNLPESWSASTISFRVQVYTNAAYTGTPIFNQVRTASASDQNVLAQFDYAMAYNTNYYWRVSVENGDGQYSWTNNSFRTEVKPADPITPITTTTVPPDVTVIMPTGPDASYPPIIVTVPKADPGPTPVYIWVIVGIGAILTLAVIVLIIRTRRVV